MAPEYAMQYQSLYRRHWWWQARVEFVTQWIDQLNLPANGDVLDVGCGGGWGFDRWKQYGQVFGVEPNEVLVKLAGADSSHIYCGPFDRDYQPATRFKLILMLDVLEHLADPQSAIEHALDLLVPQGKLLITVPAMPCLWTTHDDLNHHYVRYTKASLAAVSTQAGLKIERSKYFFHWLTMVKLLVRCKETVMSSKPESPSIPPAWLNACLFKLSMAEQRLPSAVALPFGSSIVCVGGHQTRSTNLLTSASIIS